MNPQALAWLTCALLALAASFQVGLAAGAPWGAAAYGGRVVADDGGLPSRYRLGSAVAASLLLGAMWVVLAAVSVVDRGPVSATVLTGFLWCLVALFVLNTFVNARGQHPFERWGAGVTTALLAVLCALIAAS